MLPPDEYGTAPLPGLYDYGIGATPRQRREVLRNAAYVYVSQGDEQSCQRELAAMRVVYDEHQRLIASENDDPNVQTAWRRGRGHMLADCSAIIGSLDIVFGEVDR